jgi:hypothetical protein
MEEAPVAHPNRSSRRVGPTSDRVLAPLESTDWDRGRAAEVLGVSRVTFWRWLAKYQELRRVSHISLPDLRETVEACGGDLELAAKKLGTTVMLVRRRLGDHR